MKRVGLAGNPNSGKTTLFNSLTGLLQKTGNYPGVTTEVHTAETSIPDGQHVRLYDLPGAYSLYPNTSDEFELVKLLLSNQPEGNLDLIVYVADITELDKQLLLLTQLLDLGLPCVMLLTMVDKLDEQEANAIQRRLSEYFTIPILLHRSDKKSLIKKTKEWIGHQLSVSPTSSKPHFTISEDGMAILAEVNYLNSEDNIYYRWLQLHHEGKNGIPSRINEVPVAFTQKQTKFQIAETMSRYESLQLLEQNIKKILQKPTQSRSDSIDKVVTHPFFGGVIFLILLFFIFQAIYAWAEFPMNFIDSSVGLIGEGLRRILGQNMFADFIVDGLLAGLGGIIIFIPQIAILFFLLGIMEESGYMARAVYMFDHVMRRFGLSGRSMVSLMSAGACAIPAVMSARAIQNNKERLITILVAPFISCSARIPVYTILIGLAVPATTVLGLFNLKGLVFTALYVASIFAALFFGFVLKFFFKRNRSSELLIELPHYKIPNLRNVGVQMWNKTKAFVVEAGKIILLISMALWFLGSYGPGDRMIEAENRTRMEAVQNEMTQSQIDAAVASSRLEASYAGAIGKWMEPIIEPLGYDWKIGIALLASFAAREVFVGTMATIYSMENQEDELGLQARLAGEVNPKTGVKVFNFATSISLLVFFLLAMQCMSTLAIVKRETNSWKWPLVQFVGMTILAYTSAYFTYQWLS